MLCGSSFCGCAVTSVPADFAEIDGAFPTIDVAGNGTGASPWNLTLNDEWAGKIVDGMGGTYARSTIAVSALTGSYVAATLNARTTNDGNTFGGVVSNTIPILRPGVYFANASVTYYSSAAIGAVSTYLSMDLVSQAGEIASAVNFIPGHTFQGKISAVFTVATTGSIQVRHADNAARSLAVLADAGSYLEVIRLGSL